MKIVYGKQVYDQMSETSRAELKPIPCDCLIGDVAKPDCEECLGGGIVYEVPVPEDEMQAIIANLRRQGVPIGN